MAPMGRQGAGERTLVDRIRTFQRSCQANKRCADCVERGPTYICLDFQTFVCQTCSGIHREFGHKIKGISLSEWTPVEVEAIEAGGNERAAQKWLDRWKQEEFPEPDSSNMDSVREFIKSKYVDKRWFQHKRANDQKVSADTKTAQTDVCHSESKTQKAGDKEQPPLAKNNDIGDLLSDAGNSPVVAAPQSSFVLAAPPSNANTSSVNDTALAAPPAAADCQSVLIPAVPTNGANEQWTADFGTADSKICTNAVSTNGNAESLLGLDFGIEASINIPVSAAPPSPSKGAIMTGLDLAFQCVAEPKGSSSSGLQDLDVTSAAKLPVAEPAEEPAPTPPGTTGGVEAEATSLGDRLRQAVLTGSTDDLKRLFKQCSEPPEPARKLAVPDERFAAYAAFDELGSEFNSTAPLGSTRQMQPSVGSLSPVAVQNVEGAATPKTHLAQNPLELVGTQPISGALQPTVGQALQHYAEGTPSTATKSPDAKFFFIGDDDKSSCSKIGAQLPRTDGQKPVSSLLPAELNFSAPGATTPSQLTPTQLAQLMPQKLGMLTPSQLEQMNPQELVQMQMMIARALQVRSQPAPAPRPVATAPVPPASAATAAERTPSPPKEFGDLIAAFQKKNPIIGFDFAS